MGADIIDGAVMSSLVNLSTLAVESVLIDKGFPVNQSLEILYEVFAVYYLVHFALHY